jgi:glycosyltransferase involved in cell wall biosynthesis
MFAMPPITAILHTFNDELRLGRALETLHPCDEILIVDHGSTDGTLRIAREYAASIRTAGSNQTRSDQLQWARCDWALLMLPTESLTEALEAALFEWKLYDELDVAGITACAAFVREENDAGWSQPEPSTRLIPRTWNSWEGWLPRGNSQSRMLEGDLLRFRIP